MLVALLSSIPAISASSQSEPVASSPASLSHTNTMTSGQASAAVSSTQAGSPASVAEYMVAAAFTTSFRGKDYAGTVEQANGAYTGAIANLPGADASGANIQVVETNLGRMVDTLA
jgi:hypothetical protein